MDNNNSNKINIPPNPIQTCCKTYKIEGFQFKIMMITYINQIVVFISQNERIGQLIQAKCYQPSQQISFNFMEIENLTQNFNTISINKELNSNNYISNQLLPSKPSEKYLINTQTLLGSFQNFKMDIGTILAELILSSILDQFPLETRPLLLCLGFNKLLLDPLQLSKLKLVLKWLPTLVKRVAINCLV